MSATCRWTGGLRPMNVVVMRREDDDLPDGYWEARVCETGTKVLVRPDELEPAVQIRVTGGTT